MGASAYNGGMDDQFRKDLHELLYMAEMMKGAAGRAVFRDCSAIFMGIAELLERRALALAEGRAPEPLPPPPAPRRQPLNITA